MKKFIEIAEAIACILFLGYSSIALCNIDQAPCCCMGALYISFTVSSEGCILSVSVRIAECSQRCLR